MAPRLNTKCWSFMAVSLAGWVFRNSLQDIWWEMCNLSKKGQYFIFPDCLFRNTPMSAGHLTLEAGLGWTQTTGVCLILNYIWQSQYHNNKNQWTFWHASLRELAWENFLNKPPNFPILCLAWSNSSLPVTERQKTQPSTYVVREKVSKFPRCWSGKKW